PWNPIPIVDMYGFTSVNGTIRRPGQYRADIRGRTKIRTRTDITSGSVTVKSVAFLGGSDLMSTPDRIVPISQYSGTVEPGRNLIANMVNMKPFVFYFVNVACTGSWAVEVEWM